jgi:pimeloyl-ACP methyl ester carboxylesterase
VPDAGANGVRLSCEERGSGPPLVLRNGAAGTPDEPVCQGGALRPHLTQRHRGAHVEGRGHGRSGNRGGAAAYTLPTLAADIAALAEQLGPAPAHVTGFSHGALVALEPAFAHPGVVRSAAGVGAAYTTDDRSAAGSRRLQPDVVVREAPAWAADLARRHDTHHVPGHRRDLLRRVVASATATRADAVDTLAGVAVPTPWIAGEDDPWFELDQLLTLKRRISGAEILLVDHAGRGPQQTHPHLVGPAMADFLSRHLGPPNWWPRPGARRERVRSVRRAAPARRRPIAALGVAVHRNAVANLAQVPRWPATVRPQPTR